jgi:hypothetical protein
LYSDGKHVPGHEPKGFEHLSEEQSAHIGNGANPRRRLNLHHHLRLNSLSELPISLLVVSLHHPPEVPMTTTPTLKKVQGKVRSINLSGYDPNSVDLWPSTQKTLPRFA